MPAIDFLMSSVDPKPQDLDRIVVAQGPGSYTGLRVAVATAKMLAYSLSIDLVGVSSLYALASQVSSRYPDALVIPLIDARRQNAYVGCYQDKQAIKEDSHRPLDALLSELSSEKDLIFVGEVAAFEELITEKLPQARIQATLPSAFELGLLGQTLPRETVSAFVPNYLKRVEAEENWLKTHQETSPEDYIKRV